MEIKLEPGTEVRIVTDEGIIVVSSSLLAKCMFVEMHGAYTHIEEFEEREPGVKHLCFKHGDQAASRFDLPVNPGRRFIKLAEEAEQICRSDATWETKYDLIFSDHVSRAIKQTGVSFDYCDPDTSYEEDVRAYVAAVVEKAEDLKRIYV